MKIFFQGSVFYFFLLIFLTACTDISPNASVSLSSSPKSVYLTLSGDLTLTLANQGEQTAEEISVAPLSAPFSFSGGTYPGTGGTCAESLAPNSSCTLVFTFTPTTVGTVTQDFNLFYLIENKTKKITHTLTGTGLSAHATLSISDSETYDFGSLVLGNSAQKSFTVTNTTDRGIVSATGISASALSTPYAFKGGAYPGTGGNCGATLASSATCTIVLTFDPQQFTTSTATLSLSYNDGVGSESASRPLTGTGRAGDAGTLDLTYNTTGFRLTSESGGLAVRARAVVLQTDGMALVTGMYQGGIDIGYYARYKTNGTLDTGLIEFGPAITESSSIILQTDGKFVSSGYPYTVRHNPDMSLDTSFRTVGYTTVGGTAKEALALQTDGNIISAGGTGVSFTIGRFMTNGRLDTAFHTNGTVSTTIGTFSNEGAAHSVFIQTDGKIIAIGQGDNLTDSDFALVRYTVDGNEDATFGVGGIALTTIGLGTDVAWTSALQSDGKILAAGYTDNGTNQDFAMVRYNINGTLDSSFHTDGIVVTTFGPSHEEIRSIVIQTDGKILAGGSRHNGSKNDIAVARYKSDGSLDTAFHTNGTVVFSITAQDNGAFGLVIQSDGRVIAVGEASVGGIAGFAILRFWP